MIKVILASFIIIVAVWFASGLFVNDGHIVSPLGNRVDEKAEQLKKDSEIFEKVKGRVQGEKIQWAVGNGILNPKVDKGEYIVVDQKGKVVYSLNPDKPMAPSSLTKLVTAMVVLDYTLLDEEMTVPQEATLIEPTNLVLEDGEVLPVEALLQGMLITSANDATETLAYGVAKKLGGSRDLFIMLMNEKAKRIGLTNTHFVTPTGLDAPGHLSTPRDLAIIIKYALDNYPEIKKLVGTKELSITKTDKHKKYELPNWNSLLGVYPGVDGVKIGHTDESGHSMIVTSTRENKSYMVVLLGAPDRRTRDFWTAALLNTAFSDVGIKSFTVQLYMLQKRSQEWSEQLRRAKEE